MVQLLFVATVERAYRIRTEIAIDQRVVRSGRGKIESIVQVTAGQILETAEVERACRDIVAGSL